MEQERPIDNIKVPFFIIAFAHVIIEMFPDCYIFRNNQTYLLITCIILSCLFLFCTILSKVQ